MMSFNPELQRNIWLQMSWARLFVAPILIGILLAGILSTIELQPEVIAEAARWAFVLLLAFWSTRRVADSLAEEISGGTWEGQRMSGLSAWSMMWGKLIGGAIFPWYCALICLAIMIYYGLQSPPNDLRLPLWQQVATLLIGGVLGQATSLTVALLLLRKTQFRRRLAVTMAQIAGLVSSGMAIGWDYSANPWAAAVGQITWYDRGYDPWLFYMVSAGVFALWALLAVWRLMRLELLYNNRPWAWAAFMLFAMAYAAGFVGWQVEAIPSRFAIAFTIACSLTYLAFFAEAKDPVRYRWGLARFAALQWYRALEFMPWWMISYILAVLAGAATIWTIAMGGHLTWQDSWWFTYAQDANWATLGPLSFNIVALLLFTLRDVFFLLWLNFSGKRSRADLTGLVMLAIVYFPLPMLMTAAGLRQFLPAVMPFASIGPTAVIWPAIEVAAMGVLLYLRWRQATRIEIEPDHEEPTV
jgi:hypothetical protein